MLNKYKTKLIEKKQLTSDVYLFEFQLQDGQKLDFNAGQYLIMSIPQNDGEELKRLYSISSSANNKDSFGLLIKVLPEGRAGSYLIGLDIDKEVIFTGPAGLFSLKKSENDLFFLATGTGIAPVLSMLCTLSDNRQSTLRFGGRATDNKITLYWGLPKLIDIYLLEELIKITKTLTSFIFKICLSREENLNNIQEENKQYFSLGRINSTLTDIHKGDYYICGSPPVVDSLKNDLFQKGIRSENIHFEKF